MIDIRTIKFLGIQYQSTNFQATFYRFIKSYYIDFICTTNHWEETENVKYVDIRWLYSDITGWDISIFNIVSIQQKRNRSKNRPIYHRSTEILMKRDKLSNLHMLTQKITFMCHWKDLFGNDVKKRTKVEIEVCRMACLKAVRDKTITIDTSSSDKIRRIN